MTNPNSPPSLSDFADNVVDNAKIFDRLIDSLAHPVEGPPEDIEISTVVHTCTTHTLNLPDSVTTSAGGVTITPDDQEFGLNHFDIGLGPANSVRLVQFLRTLPPEPEEDPPTPEMVEASNAAYAASLTSESSRSWDTPESDPISDISEALRRDRERIMIKSVGSHRWFVRFYVPDNETGAPVKLPAPCQWWRAGFALKHTIMVAIVRSKGQAVPWTKMAEWWPGLKPDRSHMISEDWEPGDFTVHPPSDDTYREIVL